jgi:hypothetical protein
MLLVVVSAVYMNTGFPPLLLEISSQVMEASILVVSFFGPPFHLLCDSGCDIDSKINVGFDYDIRIC